MARFHQDRGAMFDLARTAALGDLFFMPRDRRGPDWLDRFYDAAWTASLKCPVEQAFSGPDGMPYLRLQLPAIGETYESQSMANLAEDCLARGCGIALFTNAVEAPDQAQFVFPFGVIDSMLRHDSPEGDPVDRADWDRPPPPAPKRGFLGFGKGKEPAREILVASPSADYLPPHSARALHHYLTNRWDLPEPRIALIVDSLGRPTRSLVIGRKRSSFRDEAFLQDLMRYTTWYLPPGRGLALMPEDWSLAEMRLLTEFF